MSKAFGIIIVTVAILGACASAPQTVAPPDEAYDTAKTLRAQIQEFNLAQYARTEFEAGEGQFRSAEAAYDTEEYAVAGEGFGLAIDNYTIVLREGFRAVAGQRREQASSAKQRADDMKASVAVPDDYAEALDIYNRAIAAQGAGNDQLAAELFENAAILFSRVYDLASDKRRQALEAIGRVDERIENLETQRDTLERDAREDLESIGSDEEGGN